VRTIASGFTRRAPFYLLGTTLAVLCAAAGPGQAQCGDVLALHLVTTLDLHFDHRFTGDYRHGEPFDVLTILPDGSGETLAQAGIRLRVRLCCSLAGDCQDPLAGVPAEEIVLWSAGLCSGTPMHADSPTDSNGWTEFSGTIAAGGCASSLTLYVEGVAAAAPIPIRINSPDTGSASACLVAQSDLAAFAAHLGNPALYSICFDYNESGVIDASDFAFFAAALDRAAH
jgi:hypothetical protein